MRLQETQTDKIACKGKIDVRVSAIQLALVEQIAPALTRYKLVFKSPSWNSVSLAATRRTKPVGSAVGCHTEQNSRCWSVTLHLKHAFIRTQVQKILPLPERCDVTVKLCINL